MFHAHFPLIQAIPFYLLCQLTYNFDYVLMLSFASFHSPCYSLDAQTSANGPSISLSVTCTTLSSLPTFPSQGSGFFPGHHVLPGCPDVTSGVSHTHTTPIQTISSPNYSVNSFFVCLTVHSTHMLWDGLRHLKKKTELRNEPVSWRIIIGVGRKL